VLGGLVEERDHLLQGSWEERGAARNHGGREGYCWLLAGGKGLEGFRGRADAQVAGSMLVLVMGFWGGAGAQFETRVYLGQLAAVWLALP